MVLYPHANKLLQKCEIFHEAINMNSRGPAEQHFYVWEPHCGCCLWAKKVQFYTPLVGGQQSNKYAFWRANIAIKKENGLIPPCSIPLGHIVSIRNYLHKLPENLVRWHGKNLNFCLILESICRKSKRSTNLHNPVNYCIDRRTQYEDCSLPKMRQEFF